MDYLNTGKLVISVQPEQEYGTYRLVARVGRLQDNGEIHGVSWQYGGHDLGAKYDGLEVTAYLGKLSHSESAMAPIWGLGYAYGPHRIDRAAFAVAIAKVMTVIEKGLEKLNNDEGYLRGFAMGDGADGRADDYAGYLLRISRILKIRDIYVRKVRHDYDDQPEWPEGTVFRKVDGSSLQMWVDNVAQMVRDGKQHMLVK